MDKNSQLYQYLRPSVVQRIFKEHKSGQNDYHKILFSLVVFEQWLKVQVLPGPRPGQEVSSTY